MGSFCARLHLVIVLTLFGTWSVQWIQVSALARSFSLPSSSFPPFLVLEVTVCPGIESSKKGMSL